jgi:DNA-binding NtrC family response regulator
MRISNHIIPFPLSMDNSILVVDDDAQFGRRLVEYFKRRDVYARFVAGTNVARHLITAMNPAVAIVEYCNLENKVEKLCAFIRRLECPTEIILMCGCSSKAAEKKARRLSPAFYFVKPFNEDDMYAVVLRILEKRYRSESGSTCFFKRRRAAAPFMHIC